MTVLDRVSNIGLKRRTTLEATVVRACRCCGAPGVYHDVPDVNVGCFNPARKGQPVGAVCPNCNAIRPEHENKGVIWERKEKVWGLMWAQIKEVFTGKRPVGD